MKQCHSVTFFVPSMNSGGVEKIFVNLMNELVTLDYDITLLLCHNEGVLLTLLDKRIKIISFNRQIRKSIIPLIKYFRSAKPEVVVSGPHYANVIIIIAHLLSFSESRVIITHHNFHDEETKLLGLHGRLSPYIMRYFYPKAYKVVAVSESLKKHIIEDLKVNSSKVKVIYNPVVNDKIFEFARIPVAHKFFQPCRDYKIIIAIGRLSAVKNLSLLIESFKEVKKLKPVKLVIIGEGPEESKLKYLTKINELEDEIDFINSTSNPYNYLSESDLLVLPSNSESFSLVIVEALSLGISVVSTSTEGPNEILEGGKYGYIVKTNNTSEMTKGILYALTYPFPRETLSLRANDFKTDIAVKKYIKLFEDQE